MYSKSITQGDCSRINASGYRIFAPVQALNHKSNSLPLATAPDKRLLTGEVQLVLKNHNPSQMFDFEMQKGVSVILMFVGRLIENY